MGEFFAPRRPLRPVRKERKVVGAQVREFIFLKYISLFCFTWTFFSLTPEIQLTHLVMLFHL